MKSEPPNPIETFLSAARGRLNRFRFLDALIWALLVAGVVAVIGSLIFIFQGFAVPAKNYWIAVASGIVVLPVIWALRLWSQESAAGFVDSFYGLKDALLSWFHFREEGKEGTFYELQASSANQAVADLDVKEMKYPWPRRVLTTGLVLLGLSTLMAFKEASPEVLERLRVEAETDSKTEQINEYLEELIEELEEEVPEEEREDLDLDSLREKIASMEQTKDREGAMRQYAELERQLREAARRLERRKDEQMLSQVGEEIQAEAELRKLGQRLERKAFAEAAAQLEEMQPQPIDREKLSERQKEMAKLAAAAQRMAAAAKSANRSGSTQSGQEGQAGQSSQGASGMEGMLSQLDQSMQQLQQSPDTPLQRSSSFQAGR
ncbi:MAG: hypothetical protein AAF236_04020 [Verrucomicrobiota bacterium]